MELLLLAFVPGSEPNPAPLQAEAAPKSNILLVNRQDFGSAMNIRAEAMRHWETCEGFPTDFLAIKPIPTIGTKRKLKKHGN